MVSATQLSSYLYCPRKLFISVVLKVEEPAKVELVKGKVWHKTYELLNKNDESIVKSIRTSDYREIYDMYRKNYAKFLRNAIIMSKSELKEFGLKLLDLFTDYWPNFDSEAKLRAVNLSEFASKHNVFGDELWEKLDPKILSEQYFKSESLNLSGIIDMIEVHNLHNSDPNNSDSGCKDKSEFYVPVEIKTGKVPDKGMWDGHRVQLAAYMLLLEDAGKNTGEGYMKYRGIEDKRVLAMNSMLRQEILGLIAKVRDLVSGFQVPDYVENKNKCTSCVHKEFCHNIDEINNLISTLKDEA